QQKWQDLQASRSIYGAYTDASNFPLTHTLGNITSQPLTFTNLARIGINSSSGTPISLQSQTATNTAVPGLASPTSGPAPLTVNFSAQPFMPSFSGCSSGTWNWTFGDGQNGTGVNVVHIYNS